MSMESVVLSMFEDKFEEFLEMGYSEEESERLCFEWYDERREEERY